MVCCAVLMKLLIIVATPGGRVGDIGAKLSMLTTSVRMLPSVSSTGVVGVARPSALRACVVMSPSVRKLEDVSASCCGRNPQASSTIVRSDFRVWVGNGSLTVGFNCNAMLPPKKRADKSGPKIRLPSENLMRLHSCEAACNRFHAPDRQRYATVRVFRGDCPDTCAADSRTARLASLPRPDRPIPGRTHSFPAPQSPVLPD